MSDGFHDVGASADLAEGARVGVAVDGQRVALVRIGGVVHAIDELCPHRGGLMSKGDLHGHHLSCPLHAWCFDVRTGAAFFPAGARVRCFEAREQAGRIEVRALARATPG